MNVTFLPTRLASLTSCHSHAERLNRERSGDSGATCARGEWRQTTAADRFGASHGGRNGASAVARLTRHTDQGGHCRSRRGVGGLKGAVGQDRFDGLAIQRAGGASVQQPRIGAARVEDVATGRKATQHLSDLVRHQAEAALLPRRHMAAALTDAPGRERFQVLLAKRTARGGAGKKNKGVRRQDA